MILNVSRFLELKENCSAHFSFPEANKIFWWMCDKAGRKKCWQTRMSNVVFFPVCQIENQKCCSKTFNNESKTKIEIVQDLYENDAAYKSQLFGHLSNINFPIKETCLRLFIMIHWKWKIEREHSFETPFSTIFSIVRIKTE